MTTLFTAKHISNVSSKGIYIIHSVTTGLDYIGSTARTFTRRWRCHLSDLRLQKHPNKFLQNVYNKYGENDLTFNVLEIVDNTDQIINREKYWVEHWKPELNLTLLMILLRLN